MNKYVIALCALLSTPSYSAVCDSLKHKEGEVITVRSAQLLGSRIQLPSNLVALPIVSNNHLWDVDGVIGTNQIFLKPNSKHDEGKSTLIFAMTEDGKVYDIVANRSTRQKNQACILVNAGSPIFHDGQRESLSRFMQSRQVTTSMPGSNAELKRLQTELATTKAQQKDVTKKAVVDALQKYQYRIYTRYDWSDGANFIGRNTISDVYDDGQFTYIRLANPNRGILSVETVIGGKRAIAPTRYIDRYGMYKVTGIYPSFTLRIDDTTIEVKRRDNQTKGNT